MPSVHMLPSALVVEARLLASARVCFTKKTWQQSTVSLPRVSAEEPATKGDSTFVTDDWDVWAIHVLRPAVDLNMFKTKVQRHGSAPYNESGWCFVEACVILLTTHAQSTRTQMQNKKGRFMKWPQLSVRCRILLRRQGIDVSCHQALLLAS